MITLRQKLYESLLDDEEDLVADDSILKDDLYKKIFGNGRIRKDQIYIDDDLNIYISGFLSSYLNPVYDNLFSGEIITEIKEMNQLDLSGMDKHFFDINKKPITIDKVHSFHVTDDFINDSRSKNMIIEEVDDCTVVVHRHEWNWIKYIKQFKINDNLRVYCQWDHRVGDPQQIHKLEGVNVPCILIGVESFKDWIRTPQTKKFDIKSQDNMDILDHIYANNKFKELYITNMSNHRGSRYKVEKVNTKKRYKFTFIRL